MMRPDFPNLLKQLVSSETSERQAAKMILYALQEAAIEPLADLYYAGVTEAEGVAIASLFGEIGGYEALNVLRDVFKYESRVALKRAAALGLMEHVFSLSQDEREAIATYLAS